ncbi:MAG TPA: glycosyltransferase family A protein [Caulobacteraceae bacterium]|jgi:hypothetical protein
MATPAFTIGIPTYNRADFLDLCLERLEPLQDCGLPYEIIVSDNASPDDTPKVIKARAERNPAIRPIRRSENRGPWENICGTLLAARGDVFVILADDDTLLLEPLVAHVKQMQAEPDLAAIYTDWIAWDDAAEREMHRYYGLTEPVTFEPSDPLGLVNFFLQRALPPEVALYRRRFLTSAIAEPHRSMVWPLCMYSMSRMGRIRFDPTPFYRELRVPKPHLQRTHWANVEVEMHYLGDEMRLTLETLLLRALQDSGTPQIPADQAAKARQAIDAFLHRRVTLSIERALVRGEFILAAEMRQRLSLWYGSGAQNELNRDVLRIVLPAAAQSIVKTYGHLAEAGSLSLRGFAGDWFTKLVGQWWPETRILKGDGAAEGPVLHVYRDEGSLQADPPPEDASVILFTERLRQYNFAAARIDISQI